MYVVHGWSLNGPTKHLIDIDSDTSMKWDEYEQLQLALVFNRLLHNLYNVKHIVKNYQI